MKEFPIKFLSLRDKNASHRRSKSAPSENKDSKSRPLSAETLRAIFKIDNSKQSSKQDADRELEESKIDDILRRLDELDIPTVSTDHVRDVMISKFADGDPDRAVEFIDMEQKAEGGIVLPYDPDVRLLGAENREGVTCYLDALLFAMFCKLEAFECMLENDFPVDDPRRKLVVLLRVWVNMLRSGKLVRSDLDALVRCGWSDAQLLEQQDTSETFAFLTETLKLPLLSLQVDLFHQGKKDKDDRKVVYERLLNLAVPTDPEGKGIKLEDCLEEYFNARVDVLRDSEESKKSHPEDQCSEKRPAIIDHNTIWFANNDGAATPTSVTASPTTSSSTAFFGRLVERSDSSLSNATVQGMVLAPVGQNGPVGRVDYEVAGCLPTSSFCRDSSAGVIRRVVVDEQGRLTGDASSAPKARRKGSSVIKAVTIPAWQFFRLIPWHALTNTEPRNDSEVAMNFEQRPIVGICLKRYAMTDSGQPRRLNTFIDIPDSLRLPHFMLASGSHAEENNGLSREYKLVLQSVVCHRGDSLHSGHYIAFARVAPKLLTDNRRHSFDPPPDYEEAQWVRFDDLDTEDRVVFVDDIKRCFREEMPYLLFYRVMPMVDMTCPPTEGTGTGPPSYSESKTSFDMASSGSLCDGDLNGYGRRPGRLQDDVLTAGTPNRSKPPSIRLSLEAQRPLWPSAENPIPGLSTSSSGDSRRPSMGYVDSGAVNSDAGSPAISPSDETTSSRLSRAASRFALGKQSRPGSQSGEGRLSFSMSRLGGLMKTSKEPLVEPNGVCNSVTTCNAIASSSDISTRPPDFLAGGEKTPGEPQVTPSKQKSKFRDRSNQKPSSSQPERECCLM